MFCPKCGTENRGEDIKFCRKCGVTLALIEQALTGQLPTTTAETNKKKGKAKRQPTFEHGLKDTIAGVGFLIASIAVFFFAPAGKIWFWSFLFPAFGLLSQGIPEILAAQKLQQTNTSQLHPPAPRHAIPPPPTPVDVRVRKTGEIVEPPPSVTESTTRLFDPPQQ
jgi:hypothetical protein